MSLEPSSIPSAVGTPPPPLPPGRLGVVGTGQMGSGIAWNAAAHGWRVGLADQSLEVVRNAIDTIAARLAERVAKGKTTEEQRRAILERLEPFESPEALAESVPALDLIVEAVSEQITLKQEMFRRLDAAAPANTILASNTSSISITLLAAATRRPAKVAGMHFMHPVPVMTLVEAIRGLQTSDETFRVVRLAAESMGKTVVEAKDTPGFLVNRVLMPMINEAIQALDDGVATAEDIDRAMMLGTNQPMGPLALADFIGLDTCLAIMTVLHEGFGDSKYRPAHLLRRQVAAGWLGRKTGRGFFVYDKAHPSSSR